MSKPLSTLDCATHSAAETLRDRFRDRSVEAQRLSHRLQRYRNTQKTLIYAVIGYAVFDPTVAFVLVPFILLQIPAVIVIRSLGSSLDRAQRATEFYRQAVARAEDRWIGDGNTGDQYLGGNEVFADDLDLFGNGSLFQYLSTAKTPIGESRLAAWLKQPASVDEILERQSAVRELSNNLELREQLAVLELDGRTFGPQSVIAWTSAPELLPTPGASAMSFVLAVAIACVMFGFMVGFGLNIWIAICLFVVEFGFYLQYRSRLMPITIHAKPAMATLSYLLSVERVLRQPSFESRLLSNTRQKILASAMTGPSLIRAAYRLLAELPLLLLLCCQLVPYIDRWRRSLAKSAEDGLLALGELEVLSSLAQYAFIRPEATFPTLVDTEKCYEALGMAHPLVRADQRVENDFQLNDSLQLLLVSGSNMSGKSTMLRTVGINAVLALCGAPICAKQARISPFSIGTAMRFQDSLEHRTSHFYAVITRLRRVMDLLDGNRPLLFLIDEILQGTNSHDRMRGAEAVVRKLIERGGIGMVTTHDLELTRIVDTLDGRAANVHFTDNLLNGEIHFDYKMRPGVVETSNALTLMRKMGLVD